MGREAGCVAIAWEWGDWDNTSVMEEWNDAGGPGKGACPPCSGRIGGK